MTFFALQYHDATQRTAPIDWYEVMFQVYFLVTYDTYFLSLYVNVICSF